jgi:anti-sigma B factor antagonist
MPRPQLSMQTDWQGAQARLSVGGEIDLLTAPSLIEAAGELLDNAPATLVVDLSEVAFCDSAGIAALIKIYHQATSTGAAMRVSGAREMVRHVLEISGVDRVIAVEDAGAV